MYKFFLNIFSRTKKNGMMISFCFHSKTKMKKIKKKQEFTAGTRDISLLSHITNEYNSARRNSSSMLDSSSSDRFCRMNTTYIDRCVCSIFTISRYMCVLHILHFTAGTGEKQSLEWERLVWKLATKILKYNLPKNMAAFLVLASLHQPNCF